MAIFREKMIEKRKMLRRLELSMACPKMKKYKILLDGGKETKFKAFNFFCVP